MPNYYIDEENNGLETPKQTVEKVKGETSNEAIVVNAPRTQPTNKPDVIDVKAIAKEVAIENDKTESDWEKRIKPRIDLDPEDNDILLVNEGMQVDNNGDVTIGRDLYVEDEIVIDGLNKLVDPNGETIFPNGSGHVGEYLKHITTGLAWDNPLANVPTFVLVTKAEFEGEYVYETNKVYIVYDTDGTCYVRYYTN